MFRFSLHPTDSSQIQKKNSLSLRKPARLQALSSHLLRFLQRVAKAEKNNNARPSIDGRVENMADYDVVFVGYPIWWYDAPMIVLTFLESYDFSGKTVIPFATSGGSPIEESTDSVSASAAGAMVGEGLLVNNTDEIAPWLSNLGYAK